MVNHEHFSVKQLSEMAGISVRTLHYYDQIGLLNPRRTHGNNYRIYDRESLFKLQQIMFYRELDLSLEEISRIMSKPDFNLVSALEDHREALKTRLERLNTLLKTVDRTINNLKGQLTMSENQLFNGFSEEQLEEYEKEAAERWDPEMVHNSNRRWNAMSQTAKNALMDNGEKITLAFRDAMPKGAASPEAQQQVAAWKQHIGSFYECTDEVLLGLGQMYVEDERFKAFYDRLDPRLAEFINEAIKVFCAARGVTE